MGLEDIGTFVEAAERGSLSSAARELGVPKSTVSRRIARLERELGQELIRRSSRTFKLTEAGDALYRQSAPAIRDLAEATRAVTEAGSEPQGDLKITAPVDLGSAPRFATLLVAFKSAWPKVRPVVDLTDRYVDLVAEGYDLAFRIHSHALEDRSSLKVRRVGPFNGGVYASPRYLDRAGRPSRPSDLVDHDMVGFVPFTSTSLTFTHTDGTRETVAFEPSLLTANMSFVPIALEAEAGIGAVANFIARAIVERGALERVLPDWEVQPAATLSLVWPGSRQTSRRLRAFLDFAAERMPSGNCV